MAADNHQVDSPLAQTMSSEIKDNALNGSSSADHPNGHSGPPPYTGQSRTMFDEVVNSDVMLPFIDI